MLSGLAVIAYWGIILFGYDTGIAGGVVSQAYFQSHFGLIGADGKANAKLVADVSSNVVSVLQAGAFFGALGSAPISARIGRRWALMGFAVIFAVGAVRIHPSPHVTLPTDHFAIPGSNHGSRR